MEDDWEVIKIYSSEGETSAYSTSYLLLSQEQHCGSSNLKNTEWSLVFTFSDKLLFIIPLSFKGGYPEEDGAYCKHSS